MRDSNLLKIEHTMAALGLNNIDSYLAQNSQEAVQLVKKLVPAGACVSCGGSVSLKESGVLDLLRGGDYRFLDRDLAKGPEETRRVYLDTYDCDVFFMSANAITQEGELYNVDGNANRVSAMTHGPKRVIVIAGENKIVPDLAAAVRRVKSVAAPANGKRLGTGTPCAVNGVCCALEGKMTDGCKNQSRMCVHYVTSAFQRIKGRITVIFVRQQLGY